MSLRRRGSKTKGPRSSKVAEEYKIKQMAEKISSIKQEAKELKAMSGGIQAVDRNVDRILASIKMLEINISDLVEVVQEN